MRYTLDPILSIGIIEHFQLVSILIFLYTHIWFVYVCLLFQEYQCQLVSNFHTYMFYLCLLYSFILEHENLFMLSLKISND